MSNITKENIVAFMGTKKKITFNETLTHFADASSDRWDIRSQLKTHIQALVAEGKVRLLPDKKHAELVKELKGVNG